MGYTFLPKYPRILVLNLSNFLSPIFQIYRQFIADFSSLSPIYRRSLILSPISMNSGCAIPGLSQRFADTFLLQPHRGTGTRFRSTDLIFDSNQTHRFFFSPVSPSGCFWAVSGLKQKRLNLCFPKI